MIFLYLSIPTGSNPLETNQPLGGQDTLQTASFIGGEELQAFAHKQALFYSM
jgi:hypothetical protein